MKGFADKFKKDAMKTMDIEKSLEKVLPDYIAGKDIQALVKETNKNDKSDDGDGLDAVQPKAVKKKFADRKDKDIDNDGDVDSSDKFLHKRRKAVSKAMQSESLSLKETVLDIWKEAAKDKAEMAMGMPGMSSYDPSAKKKKKAEQKKTDTGMPMTPVDTSPKMPKMKNEKNKV